MLTQKEFFTVSIDTLLICLSFLAFAKGVYWLVKAAREHVK